MKSLVYMSLAAILFITNVEFASKMENKADESFIVHRQPVDTGKVPFVETLYVSRLKHC